MIYGQRPRVCGRYKCRLLQDTEAGVIPLGEALIKVETAHDLLSKVTAAKPPEMSLHDAKALAGVHSATRSPYLESGIGNLLPLKLLVTSLIYYLDKHFRNSREGKMLGSQIVGNEIQDGR
jgi:hypothetical protein